MIDNKVERVKITAHSNKQQIALCISKILNWFQPFTPGLKFEAEFISPYADSVIMEKQLNYYHSTSLRQIVFDSSMLISYAPQQSIIQIRLFKSVNSQTQQLGLFQVDFQQLKNKQVQYYPFGQRDQLLVICQIEPNIPQRLNQKVPIQTQIFRPPLPKKLDTERPFKVTLKSQGPTRQVPHMSNSNLKKQLKSDKESKTSKNNENTKRVKKSFSEKVFTLLQQVKTFRQSKSPTNANQKKLSPYSHAKEAFPLTRVQKSHSEKANLNYKFKQQPVPYPNAQTGRNHINDQRTSTSKRHRLHLETLNLVPCSDYYPQQRQPQTRKTNLNRQKIPMKGPKDVKTYKKRDNH